MKTLIISISMFFAVNVYSQSWVTQNSGTTQNIYDIFFINSNIGYASCDGGILLKTTNGGNNWMILPGPYTNGLNAVRFFDLNTGLVLGNPIYKTTNAGLNWFQAVTLVGTLHHWTMADGNTLYGCEPFKLAKTTNRGDNWQETASTPPWITTSAFFINAQTGWVSTIQPVGLPVPVYDLASISNTVTGGTGWTTIFTVQGAPNTVTFGDVFFPSLDTGFIIGKSGESVYKTYNGGTNWSETVVGGYTMFDLFFTSGKTGWACAANGYVYKTTNSGVNWLYSGSPVNVTLNSVFFVNELTGWAVGNTGSIIKTTNGGITAVNHLYNSIPQNFCLSQNYPNPFNSVTRIKFDLPKSYNVKLVIYDVLGREIETLLDESKKPGSYEVTWDGSRYASGVYFYKLVADDYVVTKKMVLLK